MIVKEHKSSEGRSILAIVDTDILGKVFEEGDLILDLSSDFYNGVETKEEKILELTKKPCVINVVGEKAISFCIENELIDGDNVKKIDGVPHAQGIM